MNDISLHALSLQTCYTPNPNHTPYSSVVCKQNTYLSWVQHTHTEAHTVFLQTLNWIDF